MDRRPRKRALCRKRFQNASGIFALVPLFGLVGYALYMYPRRPPRAAQPRSTCMAREPRDDPKVPLFQPRASRPGGCRRPWRPHVQCVPPASRPTARLDLWGARAEPPGSMPMGPSVPASLALTLVLTTMTATIHSHDTTSPRQPPHPPCSSLSRLSSSRPPWPSAVRARCAFFVSDVDRPTDRPIQIHPARIVQGHKSQTKPSHTHINPRSSPPPPHTHAYIGSAPPRPPGPRGAGPGGDDVGAGARRRDRADPHGDGTFVMILGVGLGLVDLHDRCLMCFLSLSPQQLAALTESPMLVNSSMAAAKSYVSASNYKRLPTIAVSHGTP